MPHTFQELLEEIDQEAYMIHATWKIFRQLFGTNKDRVELLNHSIPSVAGVLQQTLAEWVIVSICRLCDPAMQGKNENLTLPRLVGALDPVSDVALKPLLDTQLAEIETKVAPLRAHRHKRLAHKDLHAAIPRTDADILPGVSRKAIEDALQSIRTALNTINQAYLDTEVAYAAPILAGDGDVLLLYLQMAERLFELQKEAWTSVDHVGLISKLREHVSPLE
jgi:hypothetical protein